MENKSKQIRFTVPYSITDCRDRMNEQSIHYNAVAIDDRREQIKLSFAEESSQHFGFQAQLFMIDSASVVAKGTLEAQDEQSTQVQFSAKPVGWGLLRAVAVMIGFVLLVTYTYREDATTATVGTFVSLALLFAGLRYWGKKRAAVPQLYTALKFLFDLPPEPQTSNWQLKIGTRGGILSFMALIIGAILATTMQALNAVLIAFGTSVGIMLLVECMYFSLDVTLYFAIHAYSNGDYDRALRIVTIGKWLNPLMVLSSVAYSRLRGGILLDAGRYDEAAAIYQQLLEDRRWIDRLTKGYKFALYGLGHIAIAQDDLELAGDYFSHMMKAKTATSGIYHRTMAYWYLLQENQPEQALQELEKIHPDYLSWVGRKIPQYGPALTQALYAWTYAQLGDHDKARAHLQTALETTVGPCKPDEAEVHYFAAQAERTLGNWDRACDHLNTAIGLVPNGHMGNMAQKLLMQQLLSASDSGEIV
jgi:tetratricopeptide (TPR) repeat protein